VNALDAAFVAYAGISALRQQIRPEQRVHGVISGRDWTPNGSFVPLSSTLHHVVLPHVEKIKTGGKGGRTRTAYQQRDTDWFFFCICDSHPRLRQDVMVRPRGRVGCGRAAARARDELPRVRARAEKSAR
jgi:hypothetical protein